MLRTHEGGKLTHFYFCRHTDCWGGGGGGVDGRGMGIGWVSFRVLVRDFRGIWGCLVGFVVCGLVVEVGGWGWWLRLVVGVWLVVEVGG